MVSFDPQPGVRYRHPYLQFFANIRDKSSDERIEAYRWMCRNDLFFLLYFGLKKEFINASFRVADWWVNRIREVEDGPKSNTLDLWFRLSGKCGRANDLAQMGDGSLKRLGDVVAGDRVVSFDDGCYVNKGVLAVENTGVKPVRSYRLISGRKISVTAAHHLLTWDGWVEAGKLAVGDFIAVPRVYHHAWEQTLPTAAMKYLGYMLADGSLTAGACNFTKLHDLEVAEDFKLACCNLGFQVSDSKAPGRINVRGAKAFNRLHDIQGYKSTEKKIPEAVFTQSLPQIAAFIGAFWSCDGYISKRPGIALANENMIDGLQNLLSRFGIHARKCPRHTTQAPNFKGDVYGWLLELRDVEDWIKLAGIGIPLERKQAELEKLCLETGRETGFADTIPIQWLNDLSDSPYRRKYRNTGLAPFNFGVAKYTSRAKALAFAKVDHNQPLIDKLDNELSWEEIREISDEFETETVDIQVEGSECFIANGIISHNSTILTIGENIQDVLKDPTERIAIFSFNRALAKAFLLEIKQIFEGDGDNMLPLWFPDIVWANPRREAPKWNMDDGLFLKRPRVAKEATFEAWGLVDSQPTGRHYTKRSYDDVVDKASVYTPGMMQKSLEGYQMSKNLRDFERNRERMAGTRYDFGDTYGHLEDLAKHGKIDLEVRIHSIMEETQYGTTYNMFTAEEIEAMREEQGEFVFACTPGEAPILMSDWTDKPISEIKTGDSIVGFTVGDSKKNKGKMISTKVKRVFSREAYTQIMEMASGKVIRCTPDHRWFTGRTGSDGHKMYLPAEKGRPLQAVIDPKPYETTLEQEKEWGYLGGMIDGEGSCAHGAIIISQTEGKNSPVCRRIERCLNILNLPWNACNVKREDKWEDINYYYLKNCRQSQFKVLKHTDLAKAPAILRSIWSHPGSPTQFKDKVKHISLGPREQVYALETETGNYVVWGYASSNSQQMLNPVSPADQKFRREYLTYWTSLKELEKQGLNDWPKYLLIDLAGWDETGKSHGLDRSAFIVVAVAPDNRWYVLDVLIDRVEPNAAMEFMFSSHDNWKWDKAGIEEETLSKMLMYYLKPEMQRRGHHFKIEGLKHRGRSKGFRIQKLEPQWSRREIVLHPEQTDLIQEFMRYPADKHRRDGIDALAYGPDLIRTQNKVKKFFNRRQRQTAMNPRGAW